MPARILLLQQGDPAKPDSAGSGTPFFLRRALEGAGAVVRVGDCEPTGWQRYELGIRSYSPDRARWTANFNIAPSAFDTRSRIAKRHIQEYADQIDAVIQYGSSFSPGHKVPYYCFSDDFTINAIDENRSWGSALGDIAAGGARLREHELFHSAAGIFSFSRQLKQRLIEKVALKPDKVQVTYPGPNWFELPILGREGDRAVSPTILFIGREWERKGGDVLLKSFAAVRKNIPSARLTIVGPQIRPVSGPGIDYVGYLSKNSPEDIRSLEQLFRSAWVFCLPTRYEPFGMVFVEAMWYGLPTIGTKAWAIPEIIEDGITGYCVPLDELEMLTARLILLLTNSELRCQMGAAARARAEALFSWESSARSMLAHITP